MSIQPKNWTLFQHYKGRTPPWIKLHKGLLDDYAFHCLPLASKALAPLLWLLASEYEDGKITASMKEIAYRLHTDEEDLVEALKPLVDAGFFIDASNVLATCKQDACLEEERETEEEEEDTPPPRSAPASNAEPYFFESGMIRLREKDFRKWEEAFPKLDLRAELISLTEWAAKQPKWFFAVSSALAKRNRDIGVRIAQGPPAAGGGFRWASGIEGVI